MKNLLVAATLAATTFLASCTGPGALESVPVDLGSGQTATIYVHNQMWPSWMLATNKLALNFMVKGKATRTQMYEVAQAEKACRVYTEKSRPNELVAVLMNGALYAATAFPAGGLAATTAFKGADFVSYGTYNSIAYGGGGIANGIVQEGGKVYTFQNCGREIFVLFHKEDVHLLQTSPY